MVETRIRAESAIAINLLASPAIMNQQMHAKGAIVNTAIKAGRIGDEWRIRAGVIFVHGYLLYFAGTTSRSSAARIDEPPASLLQTNQSVDGSTTSVIRLRFRFALLPPMTARPGKARR